MKFFSPMLLVLILSGCSDTEEKLKNCSLQLDREAQNREQMVFDEVSAFHKDLELKNKLILAQSEKAELQENQIMLLEAQISRLSELKDSESQYAAKDFYCDSWGNFALGCSQNYDVDPRAEIDSLFLAFLYFATFLAYFLPSVIAYFVYDFLLELSRERKAKGKLSELAEKRRILDLELLELDQTREEIEISEERATEKVRKAAQKRNQIEAEIEESTEILEELQEKLSQIEAEIETRKAAQELGSF